MVLLFIHTLQVKLECSQLLMAYSLPTSVVGIVNRTTLRQLKTNHLWVLLFVISNGKHIIQCSYWYIHVYMHIYTYVHVHSGYTQSLVCSLTENL